MPDLCYTVEVRSPNADNPTSRDWHCLYGPYHGELGQRDAEHHAEQFLKRSTPEHPREARVATWQRVPTPLTP